MPDRGIAPSGLDRALRFKAHLRVVVDGPDRVFILSEDAHHRLQGPVHAMLVPLLDGRTVGEVLRHLADRASTMDVLAALVALERDGHVTDAVPGLVPEATAFLEAHGAAATACSVAIESVGAAKDGELREACTLAGLRIDPDALLQIVVTDDYLSGALDVNHRQALATGRPWLIARLTGKTPWFGPLFRSGGPCWACLAHRLRENRPVEAYLERRASPGAAASLPSCSTEASRRAAAATLASFLALRLSAGVPQDLGDRLHVLDLASMRITGHPVVRRPQCAACGDPDGATRRSESLVRVTSRLKTHRSDGGHRILGPDETFARNEKQISPLTGIVSSLGPMTGRDHPLRPVWGAAFYTPPPNDPAAGEFHSTSLGKGRTPAQARASALCEAIERRLGMFWGDEPRVLRRVAELDGVAVDPRSLQPFSEAQFRARRLRSGDERALFVPDPFDPAAAIEWSPATSLTHGARRYLPSAYAYLQHPDRRFFQADSNGSAAGNCVEEAIVQGLLELVERDAVAIWWYNRIALPGVDLGRFGEYFLGVEEHYRAMGWRVWALDLTHDLAVPTYAALGRGDGSGRWCIGFGAHLDAPLALQRAFTELAQLFDPRDARPAPWNATPADSPFLHPAPGVRPRTAADHPPVHHDDLQRDVALLVERVAGAGLETLVLDQSRPDVDLRVVRVVVPGLRHIWPRFGPGRLYDVPVQLRLRERPLDETELNPVPLLV